MSMGQMPELVKHQSKENSTLTLSGNNATTMVEMSTEQMSELVKHQSKENSTLTLSGNNSTTMVEMSTEQMSELVKHQSKENSSTLTLSDSAALLNSITIMLWCIAPLVLLVVGSFGNVMIVVVMRGMRASQSTASLSLYFTALAVSDQCLLTSVMWFWVDVVFSWPPSFFRFDLLCTVTYFVWYACTQSSAWLLVAMTYQRVTSVVVPHRVGVLCTVRRGKFIIAVIGVTAFVLNFHFLFTFAYSPEYEQCVSRNTFIYFIDLFTILDIFLASVIPFLLLLIGNSILVAHVVTSLKMSREMRAKDNQQTSANNKVYPMTITLILTSTAFLALTLPICIFDTYRRMLGTEIPDDHLRAVLNLAEAVTQVLWFTASASNFYLYLLSGTKFREETRRRLCCWRGYLRQV